MHQIELQVIGALVDAALAKGYLLSVYDGQDTTVSKSADKDVILPALGSVDEEHLIVHDAEGVRMGRFFLVYGNEPYFVVADYTATEKIDNLFREISPLIDSFEEQAA